MWNDALEQQMRQLWDGIKDAQETQHDVIVKQWRKMEDLLKESGE